MHIIAELVTPLGKFGLTSSPTITTFCPKSYDVIFSTHCRRSSCWLDCRVCPFDDHPATTACHTTPKYFLSKFGITPDTHPEYFI